MTTLVAPSLKKMPSPVSPVAHRRSQGIGDLVFKNLTLIFALSILVIMLAIAWELVKNSALARHAFGVTFLGRQIWDPVAEDFGALPFIYGTLVSSLVALFLAVPLSLGTALFITELCPRWLRAPLSTCVELLAAIPSVIYGLWGIFVLAPL